MSDRPVFVPKNKRRPKKPYFHGAFTGGFSAGYFNTVGSKEGWLPKEETQTAAAATADTTTAIVRRDDGSEMPNPSKAARPKQQHQQQKIEDFMDEQDHNVWGGPTSVNKDYDHPSSSSERPATTSLDSNTLEQEISIAEPPANVGHRLMRFLGWKDGSSSAYVSLEVATAASVHIDALPPQAALDHNLTKVCNTEHALLTSKRLKRIRLQQSRVRIPRPKMDSCGLGFSPHQNAPEFQKHFEQRRRLARERAQAATEGGGGRNVYRVSNLLLDVGDSKQDDGDDNNYQKFKQSSKRDEMGNCNDDAHDVSYETVQDFVGSKTAAGFALRDDDDDVYDAAPLSQKLDSHKVNKDKYDTVIYEHDASDDEEVDAQNRPGGDNFGGLLSSWASTATTAKDITGVEKASLMKTNDGGGSLTSDGRPPLLGFVLGGGTSPYTTKDGNKNKTTRFTGPNIPLEYTVTRHEFKENECPDKFRDMSTSIKHERMLERKQAVALEPLVPSKILPSATQSLRRPMAGAAFAGLATQMKNRFTSGDKHVAPLDSKNTDHPVGLHNPELTANQNKVNQGNEGTASNKDISIVRTVAPFFPEHLLCKRFGLRVQKSVGTSNRKRVGELPTDSEAFFFDKEILKSAAVERKRIARSQKLNDQDETTNKDTMADPVEIVDKPSRPSIDNLKSIFESETDSSGSESENEGSQPETPKEKVKSSHTWSGMNAVKGAIDFTVPKGKGNCASGANNHVARMDGLAEPGRQNEVEDYPERELEGDVDPSKLVAVENDDIDSDPRRHRRHHRRSRSCSTDGESNHDNITAKSKQRKREYRREHKSREDKKNRKRKKHSKSSKRDRE